MRQTRSNTGQAAEDLVTQRLQAAGYDILDRNWRAHGIGELDIIAKHPQSPTIAFVEVRSRHGSQQTALNLALESIRIPKKARLLALAEAYLDAHNLPDTPWRIDVAAVAFDHGKATVEIILNAIEW